MTTTNAYQLRVEVAPSVTHVAERSGVNLAGYWPVNPCLTAVPRQVRPRTAGGTSGRDHGVDQARPAPGDHGDHPPPLRHKYNKGCTVGITGWKCICV